MSSLAILLVLVSAFTHAGWNLLGKVRNPTAASFLVANVVGSILLLPALVALGPRIPDVPPSVWWSLLATGFFQALYYTALAGAYRAGDMSVAYPVARSVPVLLTTAFVAATRGIGSFSVPYAAGCLLVVTGLVLVPARARGPGVARSPLVGACTLLALCAALGSTGYSLVDSAALSTLRGGGRFSATEAALFYLAAEALSSTVWMVGSVLLRRAERRELRRVTLVSWRPAALMGLGIYLTYGLVLVAMAFARNVGYIVAFRQLSIPLGAVLAILIFREPAPATRIAGIAVTCAGLVLVALG